MNRTRVLAKGYIEVHKHTHHHPVTISFLFSVTTILSLTLTHLIARSID
jgi:hypothetical protein